MNRFHFYIFATVIISFFISPVIAQSNGWFSQNSGTLNNLNAVYFHNTSIGTVVGNGGIILRTTNGGINWVSQNSGTSRNLYAVYFINQQEGFAAGDSGIILKTVNGGASWVILNSNTVNHLYSIVFANNNTGYVAGSNGTVVKSNNGGNTWNVLNTGTTANFKSISFINNNNGFAAGSLGTIIKTINGGDSWSNITSGTTITFEQVMFTNVLSGMVVGEAGRIQRTTNGGSNWIVQSSGTGNWLTGFANPFSSMFIVTGESGIVKKTSNEGSNWLSQVSNITNRLNKTVFLDTNIGFAVGNNGVIIKTASGGWLPPETPVLISPLNGATCVSLTAVLDWNDIAPPTSLFTVQISTQSNFNTTLIDVDSILSSNFSIPGGALTYNTQYYWRVKAINQVGEGSWSSARSFSTTIIAPIAPNLISPPNNTNGTSLTPTLDWNDVSGATNYRIRISTDTSFSTNVVDTIGITASIYTIPSGKLTNNVWYFWKVNSANACAAGPSSSVWSFRPVVTGGVIEIIQLPKEYKLYNNYPNPFNPVTKIKFDIPMNSVISFFGDNESGNEGDVRLSIYDILGREVAVLLSSRLIPGTYDILWDASNYSSGLYFYKLTAGTFKDIKKMVLIK